MFRLFVPLFVFCSSICLKAQSDFLIEAESFISSGGWLVDPQFVEQMGSPYLLAHGMGEPVDDAFTSIDIEDGGKHHIWARTKNWVPGNWQAPGRFQIVVNDSILPNELGVTPEWGWEYAGSVKLEPGITHISLKDLTGFDGRCDALYFSPDELPPPNDLRILALWRQQKSREPRRPSLTKRYDLVVTGGGLAGCAAAIAAGEQGLKVALIHDRPLLGGNASSEIRVHTLGIYGKFERILRQIDTEHYPNGSSDAILDQTKRDQNMQVQANVDLHLNFRAYNAVSQSDSIQYVDARHTSSGDRIRFEAPLFVDATGDGWIGYWSGAEFSYGRESVNEYDEHWERWGELWSPEEPDNAVMGSSILFQTTLEDTTVVFENVPWALDVAKGHEAVAGEWYWEFSRNDLHQIHDGEQIRDHMLRAIFGSFANAKTKEENAGYRLQWVSYLLGKRESRRLVGDHIFTFRDVLDNVQFPDSVVQEIREIDVHYQENLVDEEKPDFLSKALFYRTGKYYIPYRSLYSKNISNLFMAGRCFSCSHVGLGGPRVMRTTGQMGAAVGLAASLCKKYGVDPRTIYESHLAEYMQLIESQQSDPE
ncbi:MAG: FAD-dependent oxidoreductase [Saprospiraceae bacterium]|nr:FAD-dependent oxidoreductase [Saprospiraceae bacterium]